MTAYARPEIFLARYDQQIYTNALKLREVVLNVLPGVIEQIDISAKMVIYCYGRKYSEMVCMIIPSKKRLKLAFYKGAGLPDPDHLLEGRGQFSRYVHIKTKEQITSAALQKLLEDAFTAYRLRITKRSS